jgi:transcriptional regulator with XRE-family HTH domain
MEKISPQPHPVKQMIKDYGLNIYTVAKFLGLSYSYTSAILNGFFPPTPEVQKKLDELTEITTTQLEKKR